MEFYAKNGPLAPWDRIKIEVELEQGRREKGEGGRGGNGEGAVSHGALLVDVAAGVLISPDLCFSSPDLTPTIIPTADSRHFTPTVILTQQP